MKKISLLIALVLLIAFSACNKTELPIVDKGKPDPEALITIRPAQKQTKAAIMGLSNQQIVEDALIITWQSHYANNKYEEVAKVIARGFNEQQKDFDIPALRMLGIDVISAEGDYYRDLTYAFDVFIVNEARDTIAYVPNEVINNARVAIEAAFADENYTEVYELFNTAFVFLPIE